MHGGRTLSLFLSPKRARSFGIRRAKTNERTSPERVRSPRGLGRGGVSFSVASDHRDRDRCDQPPRSRCRGQHHYTVVRLVLFLSFLVFSLLLPLSLSFFLSRSAARFPAFALCPSSTYIRFPDVSIAGLRAPPRR